MSACVCELISTFAEVFSVQKQDVNLRSAAKNNSTNTQRHTQSTNNICWIPAVNVESTSGLCQPSAAPHLNIWWKWVHLFVCLFVFNNVNNDVPLVSCWWRIQSSVSNSWQHLIYLGNWLKEEMYLQDKIVKTQRFWCWFFKSFFKHTLFQSPAVQG